MASLVRDPGGQRDPPQGGGLGRAVGIHRPSRRLDPRAALDSVVKTDTMRRPLAPASVGAWLRISSGPRLGRGLAAARSAPGSAGAWLKSARTPPPETGSR